MEHPSETFLASLEEDLMRLTVKHGQTVGTDMMLLTVRDFFLLNILETVFKHRE